MSIEDIRKQKLDELHLEVLDHKAKIDSASTKLVDLEARMVDLKAEVDHLVEYVAEHKAGIEVCDLQVKALSKK